MERSGKKIKELELIISNKYEAIDEDEIKSLGYKTAKELKNGDVILMIGDLGAGKTTITRVILDCIGVNPLKVRSPTFNIVNTYQSNLGTVYHIDTYRVSPFELYEIGFYDYFDGKSIVIIEWADKIIDDLEKADFLFKIEFNEADPRKRDLSIYKKR